MANRILILGESWYGPIEPLETYIPDWANRRKIDRTFTRIFNAASGLHSSHANPTERLGFWHKVAFYNFVPYSIGDTNNSRPKTADYEQSMAILPTVVKPLNPRAVWILGIGQGAFSSRVLADNGIKFVITRHPTSRGTPNELLRNSWANLLGA